MSCLQLLPLRMKPWRPCAGIQFRGTALTRFIWMNMQDWTKVTPQGFGIF